MNTLGLLVLAAGVAFLWYMGYKEEMKP